METDPELENLRNEVLRKIGRNVMLFQQMEHMLKCLLANNRCSGYASEYKVNLEKHKEIIQKKTLGQAIGQFVESTFSNQETTNPPDELIELWFSTNFTIECDAIHIKKR